MYRIPYSVFLAMYLISVCGYARSLPTTEQFDGLLRVCATNHRIEIDADLIGSITSIYDDDKVSGKAILINKTDFFQVFPENQRKEAYKLYTQCVVDIIRSHGSNSQGDYEERSSRIDGRARKNIAGVWAVKVFKKCKGVPNNRKVEIYENGLCVFDGQRSGKWEIEGNYLVLDSGLIMRGLLRDKEILSGTIEFSDDCWTGVKESPLAETSDYLINY